MVGPGPGDQGRGQHGRGTHLARGAARTGHRPPLGLAALALRLAGGTGEFVLSARATDAEGHTQPLEQPWNRGGFANNLVQRVQVLCMEGE